MCRVPEEEEGIIYFWILKVIFVCLLTFSSSLLPSFFFLHCFDSLLPIMHFLNKYVAVFKSPLDKLLHKKFYSSNCKRKLFLILYT